MTGGDGFEGDDHDAARDRAVRTPRAHRGAFHQSADRRSAQADDQVTFPVSGYGPISCLQLADMTPIHTDVMDDAVAAVRAQVPQDGFEEV